MRDRIRRMMQVMAEAIGANQPGTDRRTQSRTERGPHHPTRSRRVGSGGSTRRAPTSHLHCLGEALWPELLPNTPATAERLNPLPLTSPKRETPVFVRALTTALIVTMAACGGGGSNDRTAAPGSETREETTTTGAAKDHLGDTVDENPDAPTAGSSYVATAKVPQVAVYARAEGQETTHALANPYPNGVPLVLLVDGADTSGNRLRVYLPVKPNGSKGWVNADDVEVTTNTYRVEIELTAHKLTVTNGRDVVVRTPVGLGADGMETPQGTFFLKELLQPPNPDGAYGPYAYGTSAFTENPEVADDFGDDGVIGIHGTNEPASIGTNSSHGCIRMANEVITQLADILPLGTPVQINA